jgi:hypothetical protein
MIPLAAPNSGYCRPFFACQRIEGVLRAEGVLLQAALARQVSSQLYL